jgi:TolB-like protein/class 3 adenylate cyclase/Flp pilus assembly protein TadD
MPSELTEHRKLAAIMFTDMVGYRALAQRDEALALELLEEHRQLLRAVFSRFNGTEIKTIGDAFLVEFHSALEAAQCGIEIQRALAKRNHDVPAERRIELKIGIHIGDVVHRGGDVYGDGVNIASRIEPLAGAGGICVSMDVERQIRNALEARFERLGPAELKNISVPMELFRIVLPWETSSSSRREEAHSEPGARKAERARRSESLVTSAATRFGWIAVLVILAVGVGWWFVHQSGQAPKPGVSSPGATNSPEAATTSATGQKSIAVLPFVNMSADKADEYLSDGMTEELLNALAKVPELRVPGRSSSFAFKGKTEQDIFRKVGEQLHVSTVLEGSIRKAGDRLRITAQLINVADGFHLWSETYDAEMKDILTVQSDVAQRVVQALQVRLGVDATRALTRTPTANSEAHRLYLLGRYHFGKASQAGWSNAMHYFNQALQLDPSYALAYCGLADNYGWMGGFTLPGKEAWAKEKELAQKALALNPDLADAHLSLGIALASAFDWQGGIREIKRALELNPRLALAYDQYAWAQTVAGEFDEAIRSQRKAIDLDPLSAMFNGGLAHCLIRARRYEEAKAQIRRALELDPSSAVGYGWLGWCLFWTGDTAGAIREFQTGKALDPQPYFDAILGYAHAALGDRAKAEQSLRDLEDWAKQRYVSPGLRVMLHLGLGEKEKALDWLERCFEEQDGTCWWLKSDPLYDPLRAEPRFQALLKKVFPDQ